MFTGIIEAMGAVVRLLRRGGAIRLEVRSPVQMLEDLKIGDSIAVNGACVTVTDVEADVFAADLVPETLGRTNLGTLQTGEEVNLERPLKAEARLDGHIVQGHVDVVGLVRSRRRVGAQELLEVNVPFELTRYLAPKGSVAVDGVSLTVVDVNKDRFRVALIPHTIASTTLGRKIQGQSVNVEVDVLSKYVERHVAARLPQRPPSIASLVAQQDAENRPAPVHTPAVAPRPARAIAHAAPALPRSAPVPRPAPPPRQQPPRFAAPAAKVGKHASVRSASKSRNSKPAPKARKSTSGKIRSKGSARSAPARTKAKTRTSIAGRRATKKIARRNSKKGKRR